MSSRLLSHSLDIQRLVAEGYEIEIRSGHLLLHNVPYVKSDHAVGRGTLVSSLTLAGDRTAPPDNHVAYWAGDFPSDAGGTRMDSLGYVGQAHDVDESLRAQHTLSRRPQPGGAYADYHSKMTTYVAIIEAQAQRLDATATSRTRAPVRLAASQSVFHYTDTATARAGIGPINARLAGERVAIVGVGGTGSYILDLVAKTPVEEIHLFDSDWFLTHNAFRSPGAPSVDELEVAPKKVAWLDGIYSRMRRGIVPHDCNLDASNVHQLDRMNFVFLSMEGGPDKLAVVEHLLAQRIPFIDVGMGLVSTGDSLSGTARVSLRTPNRPAPLEKIPTGPAGPAEYDQNIQIADINSLNAALAVIRWKKEKGFFVDFGFEVSMAYSIATNTIVNVEVRSENGDAPH